LSSPRSYTSEELSEVAAGLRRLLDTITRGDLKADSGAIARLEGAAAAVEALASATSTTSARPGRKPGSG
jgi:hypothetical protein